MTIQTARAAGLRAANDNLPVVKRQDIAVFDVGRSMPAIAKAVDFGEWSPPKATSARQGRQVFTAFDGPSIEHRLRANTAWQTSNHYSGQHANDNVDWPLAKLLKSENNNYLLGIAERYREIFEAATAGTLLIGRGVSEDIYVMRRTEIDGSTGRLVDKGEKQVTGRHARAEATATQALRTTADQPKKRAKPVAKRWQGDWPLLHAIDCRRDLAKAQSALGHLREALEAAVCHGETLEAIGRCHGVGNKTGAKGAGRALVYLGLQSLDEHWNGPARKVA